MSHNQIPPLPPLEVPEDAPQLDIPVTAAPEHATNETTAATATASTATQDDPQARVPSPPPLGFLMETTGEASSTPSSAHPNPQSQPPPLPPVPSQQQQQHPGELLPDANATVTTTNSTLQTPTKETEPTSAASSGNKQQARMDAIWFGHLAKLQAYKATNNHVNVPRKSGALGEWCRTQRRYYKMFRRGETVPLTKERKKALDDLGFVWFPGEERKKRRQSDMYVSGSGSTVDHTGNGNGGVTNHNITGHLNADSNNIGTAKKSKLDMDHHEASSIGLISGNVLGTNVLNPNMDTHPNVAVGVNVMGSNLAAGASTHNTPMTQLEAAHKAYNDAISATHAANEKLCDVQSLLERAQTEYQQARTSKTMADEALVRAGEKLLERELTDNVNDEWVKMYQKLVEYKEQHGDILFANILGGQSPKPDCSSDADDMGAKNTLFDGTYDAEFGLDANGNAVDPIPVDSEVPMDKDTAETEIADQIMTGIDNVEASVTPTTVDPVPKSGTDATSEEEIGKPSSSITAEDQNEKALAQWVSRLRKTPKKQFIDWKRQALDKIGFTWNQYDAVWIARFQELKKYKEANGHILVPSSYPILGVWVGTQRKQYRLLKRGKISHMTDARAEMLNSIGFVWEVNTWVNRFEELKTFKESTGHFLVPTGMYEYELFTLFFNFSVSNISSFIYLVYLSKRLPEQAIEAVDFNATIPLSFPVGRQTISTYSRAYRSSQ